MLVQQPLPFLNGRAFYTTLPAPSYPRPCLLCICGSGRWFGLTFYLSHKFVGETAEIDETSIRRSLSSVHNLTTIQVLRVVP